MKFLKYNFSSIHRLFTAYTLLTSIMFTGLLFWSVGRTYSYYLDNKELEMEAAISKLDVSLSGTMIYTESVVNYISKTINESGGGTNNIRTILKSFNRENYSNSDSIKEALSISMFSWSSDKKLITISGGDGILEKPIDISYRKYLQEAIDNPGNIYLGSSTIGAVSGQEIIPAGVGVSAVKKNGEKYQGIILFGFIKKGFEAKFKSIVNSSDMKYAILNDNNEVIIESSKGIFAKSKQGLQYSSFSPLSFLEHKEDYFISRPLSKYPYRIVVGYNNSVIIKGLLVAGIPYFISLIIMLMIFFAAWHVLRIKIIRPIMQLARASKLVAQDLDHKVILPKTKMAEIAELVKQVKAIEQYKLNLIQAKKSQDRFFANMSHELRTPLNGILNFSTMMEKEMLGEISEDYKEMAVDIRSSGAHLLNLVNDILDFSKMDIGKVALKEEEFEIFCEIEGAIRIVASDLEANRTPERAGIDITHNIRNGVSKLLGDRRMFKQILLNLLSNASKFTYAGEISLNVFINAKNDFVLEVKDSGIGIKQDDLAKLVVEFGQVGDGYSRGQKQGSGLGLFLVKKMAELHGGVFEITSAYGQGTVARVIFPQNRIIN